MTAVRTAILADIHACQEALDACLGHVGRQSVDRLIILGDLVGYGADPDYVVDVVAEYAAHGAIVLLGNHDQAVLHAARASMRGDAQRVVAWTRARLDEVRMRFLASLPLKHEEAGGLYVHANTWNPGNWEYVTALFDARRCFAAVPNRLIFFGHTHQSALYHQSITGRVLEFTPIPGVSIPLGHRRWLVNPGSVGQPRDGIPAVCYVVHDDKVNTLTFHRVAFDHETAGRKIRDAGLPAWLGDRLERGH